MTLLVLMLQLLLLALVLLPLLTLLLHVLTLSAQSPGLPDYALGYWHSKNRYASQADLLAAAHGFANRSIPVDVIVIDWYVLLALAAAARASAAGATAARAAADSTRRRLHWKVQGDWHFDETVQNTQESLPLTPQEMPCCSSLSTIRRAVLA